MSTASGRVAGDTVSLTAIGGDKIMTFFVVYSFGMLIGQDIWQRVFTARTGGREWAGAASACTACCTASPAR